MLFRIVVFCFFCLLSFGVTPQCRSILLEHLGAADSGFPDTWVIDGYDCEDAFIQQHKDKLFMSNAISSKKSFNRLVKFFRKLNASTNTEGDSRWGNFRITMYDESDSLVFRRYLCCDKETINYFNTLLKKRRISRDVELSSLFNIIVGYLQPQIPVD